MTPPRDVQDYEAQARQVTSACRHVATAEVCQRCIAAALRAEGRAALERAAQLCQDDATYQERGDPRGMALSTAARRIRALIAPAPESPPATEPKKRTREEWTALADEERRGTEQGMAFLDTVGRDGCMAKPAPAPESPPPDPIHEAYLAADEYGQPPSAEAPPPYWRIGRHYGIHVYRGDTPIATFHAVEDAKAAVRAYNANLDLSAPAPDLAAQLDELSNALAPYADAETGAKWDRLRAAVGARDQRIAELEAAILWALGEEGDFPTREPGEGAYWWRTELRRKAALVSRPGAATGEEG